MPSQKSSLIGFRWLLLFTAAYASWYFYYVCRYAVDIPYLDDYDAILKYILDYREAPITDKIKSLLLPHNEHIMAMTRLVSWLSYGLSGKIHFGELLLLGNGLLLIQLGLLYRLYQPSPRLSAIYFLWVVAVFLNPQYSPTSFWTMALWSNIWVLLPVTFSIFLLSHPKAWFWAIPFAIVSLFSNGNGLMIWPTGLFLLLLQQRPLKQVVIWGGMALLSSGVYFYLLRQQPSSGVFALSHLPMLPLNVLAFLGSYGALTGGKPGQIMALLVGISVVTVSWFAFKKYRNTRERTDLLLLSLMVFIILTALAVGLFRAEKGMGIIIGGRYRQYSSLAVALSLLMGFRVFGVRVNRRLVFIPWAAVGMITVLSFYRDIGLRKTTEWRTVADYHNFLHNRLDVYTTDGTPRFGQTAVEAHRTGLYTVPSRYDLKAQLQTARRLPFRGDYEKQYNEEKKADGVTCGNYWLIEEPQLDFPKAPEEAIYLVLTDGQKNIVFPTASTRNSWMAMLKQGSYFKKGLEAEAYDCVLSFRDYRIQWLKAGHKPVLYVTNTTIFDR
ncbi:MAG: hypothetical protein U0X91_31290 [Spirosomataceae bacterium]